MILNTQYKKNLKVHHSTTPVTKRNRPTNKAKFIHLGKLSIRLKVKDT